MRAEIRREGELIVKEMSASSHLANVVASHIDDYCEWLLRAGIATPHTDVAFKCGKLIFTQSFVHEEQFPDPTVLCDAFCRLDYRRFGLDSNPRNFLGKTSPIMIDFYPFLVRDSVLIQEQFDYPPDVVYARYFEKENVLATYIIRLFKDNPKQAMFALNGFGTVLLANYDAVLPREKRRLLKVLELMLEGHMERFQAYYELSKGFTGIQKEQDSLLKKLLEQLIE